MKMQACTFYDVDGRMLVKVGFKQMFGALGRASAGGFQTWIGDVYTGEAVDRIRRWQHLDSTAYIIPCGTENIPTWK